MAVGRAQIDIGDSAAVLQVVERHRPDFVINAAAYNKVDLAERDPETALRINALAVRNMAQFCDAVGATLLHYSSDHVFSGDKGSPYVETDMPSPCSAYGASKLLGELFVGASCSSYYVLRVGGVFGPPGRYSNHGNFPEFVLRKCAEGSTLRIVNDQFASPTFGTALVKRSLDVLEQRIPAGLYHLAGNETISWYDFACKIARAANCQAEITPISHREYKTSAPRPVNSALSNAKIEAAGIDPMPCLDECIRRYTALRKRERPREP